MVPPRELLLGVVAAEALVEDVVAVVPTGAATPPLSMRCLPRRRSERGESLGPPPPLLLRRLLGGRGTPPADTPPLLSSRILSISDLRHAAPIPGKQLPPLRIPMSTDAAP